MSLLLSCITTRYSLLRARWARELERPRRADESVDAPRPPQEDLGGLLCLMDEEGAIRRTVDLWMPAGMAAAGDGVLVASPYAIHRVAADLSAVERDVASLPLFNELHSLSRTRDGLLVASTGLDLLVEFPLGGEPIWTWWATERGFGVTPTGRRRILDRSADHRGLEYSTLAQTTHVNAAIELPDGTVIASLFHQGMLVAIDRESGRWRPALEGLRCPHALRSLGEAHVTFADSHRGMALLAAVDGARLRVEEQVALDTGWLQDCAYDPRRDRWILVDGEKARIVLRGGRSGDRALGELTHNPEWRVYQVLPLPD